MPLIRKGPSEPPAASNATPLSAAQDLIAGDIDRRWAAARALAGDPDGAAALAAALPNEAEPRVREAILTALVRHGGEASARAVAAQVRSEDAAVRTSALDALRAMPSALASFLRELLLDADPDVRLLTCDLARVLPTAEATAIMCEVLDRDTEVNVCAAAIDALAEFGGPDALPALARCAERFPDEPFLQFAIKATRADLGAGSAPSR